MEGQHRLPNDAGGKAKGKAGSDAGIRLHWRRRRSETGRRQGKFSRPVRLALWLGLPIGLWAAIYAVIRLFG